MGFNYRTNAGCGCRTDSSMENAPHGTPITMIHSPEISSRLRCPEVSGGFRLVAGQSRGKPQAGRDKARKKRRDEETAGRRKSPMGPWARRRLDWNWAKRRTGLKPGMASVAQNRGGGVLAPAEVEGLGLGGFKLDGRVVSGLMASIAKGLVGAQSTGAPVIAFAGFNGNWIRGLLGNVRFGHEEFSW
jgi:hypothetical protein